MSVCAEDYSDEDVLMDPLMWTDNDGGLIDRVIEVLTIHEYDEIPTWWLDRVRPYVIEATLITAESQNCGVVFDSVNNKLFVDSFSPWPTMTVQFK